MTPETRLALAAVALVVLASACSGDSDPEATPAPTTSASVGTPTAAPTTPSETASPTVAPTTAAPPATTTPPEDAATVIDIKVAGGKVTTQKSVKVKLGSKVRLVVTSDVADEVHLHTYDKKQDVAAGGTATLEFVANIPGQIPVELEKRKLTLVTLNIQ